jgi:hypothetical protein
LVKERTSTTENESDPIHQYTWWDGSPLHLAARSEHGDPPPPFTGWGKPPGCVSFYDVAELKSRFARRFTEPDSPGAIYRPVFEQLEHALRLPAGAQVDRRLSHDGVHHYLLPAFFHTLHYLDEHARDFTVVIRTFGTDGPHVAAAIDAWADGRHIVPGVPGLRVASFWAGRYDPADGQFRATSAGDPAEGPRLAVSPAGDGEIPSARGAGRAREVVLDEVALVEHVESGRERCLLIVDDYDWWKSHAYQPAAGKPLWLTLASGGAPHHVFFDDNIHDRADDSIVAVRARPDAAAAFAPLDGEAAGRVPCPRPHPRAHPRPGMVPRPARRVRGPAARHPPPGAWHRVTSTAFRTGGAATATALWFSHAHD